MLGLTVLGLSISDILRDLGYLGLALLMLAETVFPPIPSEAVLPLAGYLVAVDEFGLLPVIGASTAGSVVGAMLLYEAAARGGRPFAEKFLRVARQDLSRLEAAEDWFDRRGGWVVVFGRCVPGVRSLVSLPAGVLRMSRLKYVVLTTIGSLVWNSLLVGLGMALGSRWEEVGDVVGPLSKPLLALAVLGTATFLLVRGLRARRVSPPRAR
jgi:membrane protein DedA with SNARE-associated domain